MNRGLIISFFCICCTLAISGCTDIRDVSGQQDLAVAPENSHIYSVSSEAQEDIDALNDAANKAVRFCHQLDKNKRTVILNHKIQYLGLTDNQKKLVRKANREFGENNSTTSDRDYKVTIDFDCISKHDK